jgi:hypothetical protein
VHNECKRAADYAFSDVSFTAFPHRGGTTYEPNLYRKNSMPTFKAAVALGYRYSRLTCTPHLPGCCWHSMIGCLIGSLTGGRDIRDGLAQVAEATYLHPDARPSARRPCSGTGSAAHRTGKRLWVWTIVCSEGMERFIDAGVDGIFADHVDTLKAVLNQPGRGWRNHDGLAGTLLLAGVEVIAKTAGPPRRIAVSPRSRRSDRLRRTARC